MPYLERFGPWWCIGLSQSRLGWVRAVGLGLAVLDGRWWMGLTWWSLWGLAGCAVGVSHQPVPGSVWQEAAARATLIKPSTCLFFTVSLALSPCSSLYTFSFRLVVQNNESLNRARARPVCLTVAILQLNLGLFLHSCTRCLMLLRLGKRSSPLSSLEVCIKAKID